MNTIYNKLKPKRKYKRKPLCADINGICSIDKCRCDMGIKILKTKGQAKLDEHLLHREKVIQKIRQKQLQELDNEQDFGLPLNYSGNPTVCYQGEYGKRKEQIRNYKKMFWKVLLELVGVVILYPILIAFIDLFN